MTDSARHWSADARATCAYYQNEVKLDKEFDALDLPFARGSGEHNDYLKQEGARMLVLASHVPVQPTHPADVALTRNAERQLLGLSAGDLAIVGLMMASDIYRINRLLRSGGSLAGGAGPLIDWQGYTSMQHFVDEADEVFKDLGSVISLDKTITLYRGIGLPLNAGYEYQDVAGIGQHLVTGSPLPESFIDEGFCFATVDPVVASAYDGTASSHYSTTQSILLELEVHSGICIPYKDHRSAALAAHSYGAKFIATEVEQVIFPRGTKWLVESIDTHSAHGVPLVRMIQLQ